MFKDLVDKKQKKTSLLNVLELLMTCHNVNVNFDDDERTLTASSPDEIALVNFAESVGYKLINRTPKSIQIMLPDKNIVDFDVLHNFAFSSERKRMGIVVKKK